MATKTIVYVSHADGREVHVMEMNPETGDLSLLEKVTVTGVAMPMAVSPDRRYLYVGLRSEPFSVSSFRIDPDTGRLSFIATTKLPDNFAYISTDRAGRFLLGASFAGNKMAVNPIGPNGWVQERPVQVFRNAACCALRPDRSVESLRLRALSRRQRRRAASLRRGHRHDLAERSALRFRNGRGRAAPPAFHPNNAFLYLLNELDGTAYVYAIDPTSGTLSQKQVVDAKPKGFTGNPAAADIHLTPDGRSSTARCARRTRSPATPSTRQEAR